MDTETIRGELVSPQAPDLARLAVGAFLVGYRGLTRDAYELDMRQWVAWCAQRNVPLFEVSRPHVEVYGRELEQRGRSTSTVSRRLSTVVLFYRYCEEEGLIGRNPAAHVKRPRRSDESATLGLDRTELGTFLSTAQTVGGFDHALACLLGLNGLRVSEACGANIEALGNERGHRVITILGKGNKLATMPLAPRTARAVDAAVGERYEGPLLLSRAGQRLTRHDAGRIVRRIAKKAGINKRITPHSLRHSFITAALDAGVPLRDVQIAARHADPRTTTRYDRARNNLDRHCTYAVAVFIAGAA